MRNFENTHICAENISIVIYKSLTPEGPTPNANMKKELGEKIIYYAETLMNILKTLLNEHAVLILFNVMQFMEHRSGSPTLSPNCCIIYQSNIHFLKMSLLYFYNEWILDPRIPTFETLDIPTPFQFLHP